MSGLRRQKIALDADPLAMLGNPLNDDYEEEEEKPVVIQKAEPVPLPKASTNIPLPAPAAAPPSVVVKGLVPEPAKKKSIFDDDDDDLLIGKTLLAPNVANSNNKTTSVPVAVSIVEETPLSVAPSVNPPPAVVESKPKVVSSMVKEEQPSTSQTSLPQQDDYEGDDLFSYGTTKSIPSESTSAPKKSTANVSAFVRKSTTVKIDFNKDEEDISDLKVSTILEKENDLDYKLFGKVESTEVIQQRVQKRLDDLDREDDFLRQLDELTSKASLSNSPMASSSTSKAAASAAPVSTTSSSSAAADIDIASFDLNAYIAQESSSSGGLFD